MKFNPNFLAIVGFLLVGLVWSGGHVAWLVALGVFIFLATISSALPSQPPAKRKGRR